MWKMIKADIAYNRVLFIFLYSVIFIAVAANAIFGNLEEALATLMFFSVVVIGITAGLEELRTKQIRFFAGLPIPVRLLGINRYPVFVAYWLSLMAFLWLSSMISQKVPIGLDYLWWILTRTGAMFIWIACMNLSQDFTFVYQSKSLGYLGGKRLGGKDHGRYYSTGFSDKNLTRNSHEKFISVMKKSIKHLTSQTPFVSGR